MIEKKHILIFSSIGALDFQMSVCLSVGWSVDTFEFLCYISVLLYVMIYCNVGRKIDWVER